MQIDAPENSPHFFLIGPRAPLGGKGPAFEEVGTLVYKAKRSTTGDRLEPDKILVTDEPFLEPQTTGPFRFEADIAVYKPEPDVVIVGGFPQTGNNFGKVEILRGGGSGTSVVEAHPYDWIGKDDAARMALAGDLGAFAASETNRLPDGFQNGFHNGRPINEQDVFEEGDVLIFDPDQAGDPKVTLTIPAPPGLVVTIDDQPPEPPLTVNPRVDTVVYVENEAVFTFVWRWTFPWEARFETAKLEITPDG